MRIWTPEVWAGPGATQVLYLWCRHVLVHSGPLVKTRPGAVKTPVPEFIDPVFAKTSPKRSFSMTENKRFGLVLRKLGL
jgi:hypothetical protein